MATVLHTADTHLGYSQYHSETRSADFAAAFQTLIDEAISREVDAVVHSGDLFHHSRPDVDTLAATLTQLQRLDDAGIPFLGIVGNHEGTNGEQWVDIFGQLKLGIRLGTEPTVIDDTAFYGLDYVSPARRPSLNYDFEEHDTECAILVSHGLFSPVADGGRWNLKELMDASNVKFDGYLLGDDHMPHVQTIRETTVTYPGSTDRTASDQRAPRGFNIITSGAEADSPSMTAVDGGTAPVAVSPDGPQLGSNSGQWPSNITSAREKGVERAIEGPHGEPPVLVERHEMQTRPFRYINTSMEEGDGMGRVRNEIDRIDLNGAVGIVHLTGVGEPVLEAPLEEYVREAGAMVARVTDTRAFGSNEEAEDISFADPEAAVNRRVLDMDLSAAGYNIEEKIRDGGVATTSMADNVQDEVKDRIDGNEDDFIPIENNDEIPSNHLDTGADTPSDSSAAGSNIGAESTDSGNNGIKTVADKSAEMDNKAGVKSGSDDKTAECGDDKHDTESKMETEPKPATDDEPGSDKGIDGNKDTDTKAKQEGASRNGEASTLSEDMDETMDNQNDDIESAANGDEEDGDERDTDDEQVTLSEQWG